MEEEEKSFEDEHVDKEAEKEFGNPLTKNFFEILEGVGGEEVAEKEEFKDPKFKMFGCRFDEIFD